MRLRLLSLRNSVAIRGLCLALTAIVGVFGEGDAMTAAMPVAPVSAAPRPPAAASAHSATPSVATPAPREFSNASWISLSSFSVEGRFLDLQFMTVTFLLLDSQSAVEPLILNFSVFLLLFCLGLVFHDVFETYSEFHVCRSLWICCKRIGSKS